MAGDRFILLNSVAVVTVVFCCDNGCEYKIGGNFVILGEEGNNFSIIQSRLEKYKIRGFAENYFKRNNNNMENYYENKIWIV